VSWQGTKGYFLSLETTHSQREWLQNTESEREDKMQLRQTKAYDLLEPEERIAFASGMIGVMMATMQQFRRYQAHGLLDDVKQSFDEC